MHLMRLGPAGSERPVVRLDAGHYIDVSDVISDFDEGFFAAGGLLELPLVVADRLAHGRVTAFSGERIGPPIARPHQIICVGLNYRDHARESGQAIPEEPILFTKSPNTLIGPNDSVAMPPGATKLDWEVELAIVIGRRATYLDGPDEAAECIAGYCVVNDVSERSFQLERGGQWMKGKSCPTFNPLGPWLATPDEVPDLEALRLWLDVNGEARQRGTTAEMIFDPLYLITYISQFLTLEPGDVVNTGTPPGVGLGANPPSYLRIGDRMTLGIDGLGEQEQIVIESRSAR